MVKAQQNGLWACGLLLLWIAGPLCAQSSGGIAGTGGRPVGSLRLWAISPHAVRDAASQFRPSVDWSDASFHLRSELGTRSEGASLRATEIRPGRGQDDLLIRLECREARECAPFWAEATLSQSSAKALSPSLMSRPVRLNAVNREIHSDLVHPGKLAFLLCEQNGLKVSMKVVPLKRAGLNENVKVLDPETRRIFVARVVGSDRVESDLREAR